MATPGQGRIPIAASRMRRSEFIALLGGAAAWSLVARAQQPERVRRIGMLVGFAVGDTEAQARVAALRMALRELGWTAGRNVQIDERWAAGVSTACAATRRNSCVSSRM